MTFPLPPNSLTVPHLINMLFDQDSRGLCHKAPKLLKELKKNNEGTLGNSKKLQGTQRIQIFFQDFKRIQKEFQKSKTLQKKSNISKRF